MRKGYWNNMQELDQKKKKKRNQQKNGENYLTTRFKICTLHLILLVKLNQGDYIMENH
jgi:hypothetical protein